MGRPIGEVIVEYDALRTDLSIKRKEFKDFEENIKLHLSRLEAEILAKQRELGLTSISTENLTAYQTEKTYVRVGDWDTFINWVIETRNTQCLEKRCGKIACIEVFNEGGIRPEEIGLVRDTEICVQIRKK